MTVLQSNDRMQSIVIQLSNTDNPMLFPSRTAEECAMQCAKALLLASQLELGEWTMEMDVDITDQTQLANQLLEQYAWINGSDGVVITNVDGNLDYLLDLWWSHHR